MRTILVALWLSSHIASAYAQQPVAEVPAAAPSTSSDVEQDEVNDPFVVAYFRDRAAHAKPGAAIKAMHRTPAAGVFAVEMESGWLTYAFRVRSADRVADALHAPAVGSVELDAAVTAFVDLEPAPKERIVATLGTLGLTLEDVYKPATGPYFNNSRGVVFNRHERRFLLVARGTMDRAANACFKAAIDVSTGELLSKVAVACTVQ